MSKSRKYNGSPLAVDLDYKSGLYRIYDKKYKKYGAEYQTFEKAKKHAQGCNKTIRALCRDYC